MTRIPKKKPQKKPLTQRVLDVLEKHGPATTDAVARKVRERSAAVSKALSKNKTRGRVTYTVHAGEAVWRNGAPRQRRHRGRAGRRESRG
ncbi:MAG: hypothetical protein BroJett013_30660 [Alphaproteobacteria bacterium]|nr:MAG: hypothetical protein BroJett013_30660 [Alphaproteobacteria bacterium]